MKHLCMLTMFAALAACDAGLGASRIGDTILETGTLNCTTGTPTEQALIVGTDADPVRCGPQTQPIGQ